MDLLNVGLAFLEGVALIVSPCILPILPIVLSSGIEGGKFRPYGVIAGFVIAFSLFTLLSRKLVQWFGVDTEILRQISFWVLLLFGLILLSETLSGIFASLTRRLADVGQNVIVRQSMQGKKRSEGFWSGMVVGSAIGLVWTPCAGPILTAVIVQAIRQETDLQGVFTVLAFGLGAALPMLLIMMQGNRLMNRLGVLKRHSLGIRKAFGAVIIATVLLTAQGSLFHWNPSLAGSGSGQTKTTAPRLINPLPQPYPAPEFRGVSAWINSKPLTMQSLRGKVVLVDFWTYSCINCIRTLPYITEWDRKYRNQGLVIVGVHAPEFDFEKKEDNVRLAVAEHKIQYPVALDNHLDTWANFQNNYWPAHYLIDRQGRVVYTHFGEGEYGVTESNIRALLGVGAFSAKEKPMKETMSFSLNQTPETYLGYARATHFSSPQSAEPDQITAFTYPKGLSLHHWALKGKWFIDAEKIVAQEKGAALKLRFSARKVFLVMGVPPRKNVAVSVSLNGVPQRGINVNRQTLYTLIAQDKAKSGILEIQASAPGLSAYAFTFGN